MLAWVLLPLLAFTGSASASLVSCLQSHNLNVEIPQNTTWNVSTTPFNLRFHYTPAAIVYPTQTTHVTLAVRCATQHGVHVSALSGGHSYSASGYGSRNGALVIMFRDMARITYNSNDETVVIQPGARLGAVALSLNDQGRALAHGTCPYVGVGGHGGFGGWGMAARNWGLLIDQIVSAEMVLSNGTVVHLSATQHPDLFWAIRGASASFGIVTQYVFQTHQAPSSVVRFSYQFNNTNLSTSQFTSLIEGYQTWASSTPKEVGIIANVLNGGKLVEMGGLYMGDLKSFYQVVEGPLIGRTGAAHIVYVEEVSWITALEQVWGSSLDTQQKPDTHDTFYAKSLVVPASSPLTPSALSAFATHAFFAPIPSSLSWFVQFELWGGGNSAISSLPADATAYPHRSHLWTIQFYARSTTTSWPKTGEGYVNGMVSAITNDAGMAGTVFGAYANYLDPELSGWQEMYYAGNYARLEQMRMGVDPKGVFEKTENVGGPDILI
ncbi:glucooligosaccharide oxidase [Roridomyces roridus]|uniref:Glucooligosaccharide oxidase n=1 Tax=Roridomyces roridus TaxID=1738132 RepID=A0AAD7CEK6_9AGAR|nr:glucooligosaccharide oxidase [Roridomyces roridus]